MSFVQHRKSSLVVSDSDEEEYSPVKKNVTAGTNIVIQESDSEAGSADNDSTSIDKNASDSEYTNSEEEDYEFMNESHKVSIVEEDSSESEREDKRKGHHLKRKSIYENEPSSTKSTPVNANFRKRVKKIILSDSESEDISVETGESPKNVQVYDDVDSNDETYFEEHGKESKKENDNISNIHNTLQNKSATKGSISKTSNFDNSEIVISSSTSENEIDNEVLMFAKSEIGVGNIDPIEAQKKEHLLLNIDFTQKQLDKLNKFSASVDMDKLPDKGEKVYKSIKEHQEKLTNLQAELTKLSHKSSTPKSKILTPSNKLHTPKEVSKRRSSQSIVSKSTISPLEQKIIPTKQGSAKKNVEKNNAKQESSGHDHHKSGPKFDDFHVRDIPNLPRDTFDTADLGKKALETLNKQQTLTNKRLEQLHGSITSRPSEDQRDKDPDGLKIPLMPHQQHALAWMKWREHQKPKGGILADDMGLGKTLTMISLVLATLNDEKKSSEDSSSGESSDDGWMSRKKHKRYYGGTLVVSPASLINQWESEVKNRCKRGLLSVLVYHGNNRSIDDRKLSKYNIVITTYQILVREADTNTGMYRMEWNRIILDEAHYVRNHKSKACLAVCGLTAKTRWALTGTPIQNKEMDLYAILKFLKCSPFDDLQVWKRWVDNKNDAGKQRLLTIMKTLMLRRTKQELQAKGCLDSLPDKSLEVIEIELDHDEKLVYQKILLFSRNLFAQFLTQRAEKQHMRELYGGRFDKPSYSNLGAKTQFTKAQKVLLEHHSNVEAHEILVLLLRLRQMCCHPALIHSMLDKEDAEVNGLDDDSGNADLLNKLHNMSINENEGADEHAASYQIDERVAKNLLTKNNPVFDNDRQSSKVREVIKTVEEILEKNDKLIIVSQWTSFLKVIAKCLDEIEDAKYQMFTGEIAVKNRQAIVEKLNDPDDDVKILLLSLTAGGVGLNLVGANHLLLVDIHWNPQLEAQAQDRIYRFGQNKNVYIYKFICKETIEERVKNLQDKKLDLANYVLTGTRSVSSKLTIEDLKLLFS